MNNSHRSLFQSAEKAFQGRDYAVAESILYQLIEEKIAFADAYSLLGVIKYRQGYFAKAIEYLEKAIAINPHYCEALMYLSVIHHDLGRYDKGKKHEQKLSSLPKGLGVKRLAPPFRAKLANMHAEIGDVYRALGCYPEAKTQYEHALLLEPHYPDIRLKRILCLRGLDKASREAVFELQKLTKEFPKYNLAYLELGTTHYLQKNWPLAKAAWQKALTIDPRNASAPVYLKLVEKKVSTKRKKFAKVRHTKGKKTKKRA